MLHGLDQKLSIHKAILALYQSDRMISLVKAQAKVTGYLITCAQRKDLTPAESLAFFKIFGDEITSIRKTLDEVDRDQLKDIEGLLKKTDFNALKDQRKLEKRFAGTTPQGRDVIRKLVHTLLKAAEKKKEQDVTVKVGESENGVEVTPAAKVARQSGVSESGSASPPGGAGSQGIPREGEARSAGQFVA